MKPVYTITGATGLLGSNLANELVKDGATVFALIKDEQSKSILSKDVNKVFGDITNKADIEYLIQKSQCQYFIHLAAQTQAYDSLKYPYQTFTNNIIGTLNVLECLREYARIECIVVASSDKAYGELVGVEYTENHQLNGIYPYDASKSSTDLISKSYLKTYNLPVVITRACNIYGIGDFNKQRLIPGIVYAHKNKEVFSIRNKGKDLREYINVKDVVSAYKKIVEYKSTGGTIEAFNISSQDRKTTLEIFQMVESKLNSKVSHKLDIHEGLEIKKQFMSSDLLSKTTGWKPKFNLETSISDVIEWCLENI